MSIITTKRNGDIVLFHRGDSPKIFCRLRRLGEGGWEQRSTKTRDLEVAILRAESWHDELQFRAKYGLSLHPKTFGFACDLYLEELRNEVAAGTRRKHQLQSYTRAVERYIRPFFGERPIDQIKAADVTEYHAWRAKYWTTGPGTQQKVIIYQRGGKTIRRPVGRRKAPARTTINQENVALRSIFDVALRRDLIKPFQVPPINTKVKGTAKRERRPCFTREEYKTLMEFMKEWVKADRQQERRLLLRDYIQFLVHTGLRPGTETDNLCYKHIKHFKTEAGAARLQLSVDGKTGKRDAIGHFEAAAAYMYIERRYRRANDGQSPSRDQRLFSLSDGTPVSEHYMGKLFQKLLKEAGLLHDDLGQKRTLYSCRHTFATWHLAYTQIPIYTLAIMMGTSVGMIERHYGHVTATQAADQLKRVLEFDPKIYPEVGAGVSPVASSETD